MWFLSAKKNCMKSCKMRLSVLIKKKRVWSCQSYITTAEIRCDVDDFPRVHTHIRNGRCFATTGIDVIERALCAKQRRSYFFHLFVPTKIEMDIHQFGFDFRCSGESRATILSFCGNGFFRSAEILNRKLCTFFHVVHV